MKNTFKSMRAVALMSALTGASVLVLSGSAQAASRFHNSTSASYALLPPAGTGSSGSVSNAERGGGNSVVASTAPTFNLDRPRTKNNEPQIEDPPLPGYDPNGGASASRAAGQGRSKL